MKKYWVDKQICKVKICLKYENTTNFVVFFVSNKYKQNIAVDDCIGFAIRKVDILVNCAGGNNTKATTKEEYFNL